MIFIFWYVVRKEMMLFFILLIPAYIMRFWDATAYVYGVAAKGESLGMSADSRVVFDLTSKMFQIGIFYFKPLIIWTYLSMELYLFT